MGCSYGFEYRLFGHRLNGQVEVILSGRWELILRVSFQDR